MVLWCSQLILLAPVVAYVLVRLYAGPSLGTVMVPVAIFSIAYAAFVVVLGVTGRGRNWIYMHRYQMALSLITVVIAYVACEATTSALYFAGVLGPPRVLYLYENLQETMHFDSIRGYRLERTPSRTARITNGIIEYIGQLQGNNMGFPDRDDFNAKRLNLKGRRFAVFGDSFTAAQYLSRNWPDLAEDLTRDTERPLELLNFSIDGGGLANWWSVLTRIVKAEGYEIDGVVFVVFPPDLLRGFSVAEQRGYDRYMYGRVPRWDPRYFPSTREEAEQYLSEKPNGYIVTTSEFNAALKGEWMPKERRVPYLASIIYRALQWAVDRSSFNPSRNEVVKSERIALIGDIRQSLQSMGVPVVVVFIPMREDLLAKGDQIEVDADTREFASLIGAKLVNGGLAFKGLSTSEIRADWLPYDGHWGQGGSDRFARFMIEVLTNLQ